MWGWIIICCGDGPVRRSMVGSIFSVYSLHASSTFSPPASCDNQWCLLTLLNVSGGQTALR